MKNTTAPTPPLSKSEFTQSLAEAEQRIIAKIHAATTSVTTHTAATVDNATATLIAHSLQVQQQVGHLLEALRDFISNIVNLTTKLSSTLQSLPLPPQAYNNTLNQAQHND